MEFNGASQKEVRKQKQNQQVDKVDLKSILKLDTKYQINSSNIDVFWFSALMLPSDISTVLH